MAPSDVPAKDFYRDGAPGSEWQVRWMANACHWTETFRRDPAVRALARYEELALVDCVTRLEIRKRDFGPWTRVEVQR